MFKLKSDFEQTNREKKEVNNIKYSLIISKKKKASKNLNLKSLDSEYLNNFKKLKYNQKANNDFAYKFITEHNSITKKNKVFD